MLNLYEVETRVIPSFHATRTSVHITGAPGAGKTDTVTAACARLSKTYNEPFALVSVTITGMDPVDMRGVWIPTKGESGGAPIVRSSLPAIWPSKHNIEIFIDGKHLSKEEEARSHIEQRGIPQRGILFIDEFSQADHDLQKVAAQIMLDKRVGEHVLAPLWSVVSAGNRTQDRAGVTRMLSHVQNRICTIEVRSDYEAWQRWAFKNAIHPLIIGFAKSNAGDVFADRVPAEPGPYCTPRSLVLCTKNLMEMRTQEMGDTHLPDDHIAAEIIQGYLGEGILPKLISHIRMGNDLPDTDDIIKNPATVEVPSRLDARFVLTTSLSVHANDTKKVKPILKYMMRMDVELQSIFVSSVVARNPRALAVPEFATWVQTNQKLILAAKG